MKTTHIQKQKTIVAVMMTMMMMMMQVPEQQLKSYNTKWN
jgi:hypothetical protein